jgi:hypothetical protein
VIGAVDLAKNHMHHIKIHQKLKENSEMLFLSLGQGPLIPLDGLFGQSLHRSYQHAVGTGRYG